jgi:hypothetical protein
VVVLIRAAAGVFAWRTFAVGANAPDNVISLSGRIEGDDSAVAPRIAVFMAVE